MNKLFTFTLQDVGVILGSTGIVIVIALAISLVDPDLVLDTNLALVILTGSIVGNRIGNVI